MSTSEPLDLATGDETIEGSSLQRSIDALLAIAKGLGADMAAAPDFESVQAIGRAQAELNDQAMALVTAQIKLAAGEVKVTAAHINAAAAYAQDTLDAIADWKVKIAKIGKLVEFFGVVMTGNGLKILESAVKLKGVL